MHLLGGVRSRGTRRLASLMIFVTVLSMLGASEDGTATAGDRRVSPGGRHTSGRARPLSPPVTQEDRFMFYSKTNPAVGIEGTPSPHSVYLQFDQGSARAREGYFYDGSAWASTSAAPTTEDWWGDASGVPAGRTLVLPKGIYAISAYVDHVGHMGGGSIALNWYSTVPLEDDQLGQTPYYSPGFPGGVVASEHDGFVVNGVLAHYNDSPAPFAFSFSAYPPRSDVSIQDYSIMVQKIGSVQ